MEVASGSAADDVFSAGEHPIILRVAGFLTLLSSRAGRHTIGIGQAKKVADAVSWRDVP
jgi:hypothetical protein